MCPSNILFWKTWKHRSLRSCKGCNVRVYFSLFYFVRIYFSLKLVACESLFLSILFCGSLYLPGFFCEARFYLYFIVYAFDVLGNISTCPIMHYCYFWRCSFEVMLKIVIFFQDEFLCLNERRYDCIPLVCLYELILFYSRNNQISLSVRINILCPNLLLDLSTQQLVSIVLTFCR